MKALIIGGARSGLGCARLLNQQGYDVTLATNSDFSERSEIEALGIKVLLDDKDMSLVDAYDVVVKNPGIPNDHPLVSQFDTVLNEIEIASMFSSSYDYYAISGTNGKTTTTTLLYEMLKEKSDSAMLAGNVGYALSQRVYEIGNEKCDVALEISAFQMEGTPTFSPKVYALLNLSPDHMDRYEEVDDYYLAKCKILPRVGLFVRNFDDKNIMRLTKNFEGPCINISLDNTEADVYRQGKQVIYKGSVLFDIDELKIVGDHNIMNAMFACILALEAGVTLNQIQTVLYSFVGVEHRIEFVRELRGVRYYNDSKATNPESTEVCLKAFDKPILLLAGGYDKHISFDLLKPYTPKLKKIYLFGDSALQLKEIWPEAIIVETMIEAINLASNDAVSGDVVVLSPACASYDQFDNFEERGNIFKETIKTLQ
ncbi:UDP-N-acetylmuramoyl-L-alanine--D-glutamate ligase [Erysipelothrix inopinata]|uniref:UDP-N-acetylmuramoylalanine--D-glutamate ligase n=1 Tax=Erysipelothrix inopinata TaxID=225084 RepID=A0A7G9RYA9_9FIRM|nr:UDP-N-acetylmuramoyl-L-alanine--D-glutamate ligase [Erysipelothrix inopinata]QNN60584.1 UDP-N-acetylmuramoyl-L-alanine--D-glutamate ligase [Erysipelothrix inopinata]